MPHNTIIKIMECNILAYVRNTLPPMGNNCNETRTDPIYMGIFYASFLYFVFLLFMLSREYKDTKIFMCYNKQLSDFVFILNNCKTLYIFNAENRKNDHIMYYVLKKYILVY